MPAETDDGATASRRRVAARGHHQHPHALVVGRGRAVLGGQGLNLAGVETAPDDNDGAVKRR